jgi:ketosteroid isomerase-like protein
MKKRLLILPLVILLCLTFACQQAEEVAQEVGVAPLSDEDVAAIKAMGPTIDKHGLAGDWEAFSKIFAEDMLMMPPNMPVIEGRSAWLTWIKSMDVKMTESKYEIQEIEGYGDLAYIVASYTETFSIAGVEEPIYDEGKILAVLRKQPDGSWLFKRWVWASNLPLPE